MNDRKLLKTNLLAGAIALLAPTFAVDIPKVAPAFARARGRPGNRGNRSGSGARPIVRRRSEFELHVDAVQRDHAARGLTQNKKKIRRALRRARLGVGTR